MFEKEIFKQICEAWKLDPEDPGRNREEKDTPNIDELRVVIETAFLASLKREEDRPVTFSLALLPQEDRERQASPQTVLKFENKLPFNVESIVKLAAAFNPENSALAIEPAGGDKTKYLIWGAIFFGVSRNKFDYIPGSVERIFVFRPDVLTVRAVTTGSLLITRGRLQIGRFSTGRFTLATPSPFTSHAMGNYIIDTIKENEGFLNHKHLYWQIYRDSLDYLLTRVSSKRHGGTIMIVPEQQKVDCQNHYIEKYKISENLQIEEMISRMFKYSEDEHILFRLAINQKHAERLDAIAQLACIDGALILSSTLNVLSFGATLKAPNKWQGKVNVGPDGFNPRGEPFDTSKLGTRHNSAIDFVGVHQGVIGFVISQDGPIRGFVRQNEYTILCWPDCQVSMFAGKDQIHF